MRLSRFVGGCVTLSPVINSWPAPTKNAGGIEQAYAVLMLLVIIVEESKSNLHQKEYWSSCNLTQKREVMVNSSPILGGRFRVHHRNPHHEHVQIPANHSTISKVRIMLGKRTTMSSHLASRVNPLPTEPSKTIRY